MHAEPQAPVCRTGYKHSGIVVVKDGIGTCGSQRASPPRKNMHIPQPVCIIPRYPVGAVIAPYPPDEFMASTIQPPSVTSNFLPTQHMSVVPAAVQPQKLPIHSDVPRRPYIGHAQGYYDSTRALLPAVTLPLPSRPRERCYYSSHHPSVQQRRAQLIPPASRQANIVQEKQSALDERRQRFGVVPSSLLMPTDSQTSPPPISDPILASMNAKPVAKDYDGEVSGNRKRIKEDHKEEDRKARVAFEQREPIQVVYGECTSHFQYPSVIDLGDAQVSPPHGIEPGHITVSTIKDVVRKVETPADVDALVTILVTMLKKEKETMKTTYASGHAYDEAGPHKNTLHFALRMAAIAKFRLLFVTLCEDEMMSFNDYRKFFEDDKFLRVHPELAHQASKTQLSMASAMLLGKLVDLEVVTAHDVSLCAMLLLPRICLPGHLRVLHCMIWFAGDKICRHSSLSWIDFILKEIDRKIQENPRAVAFEAEVSTYPERVRTIIEFYLDRQRVKSNRHVF